eukprot:m.187217 g.187217  ORF g.187217 m.187217 type:complete len:155 (-) comp13623_c1_seq15:855-1319(-)
MYMHNSKIQNKHNMFTSVVCTYLMLVEIGRVTVHVFMGEVINLRCKHKGYGDNCDGYGGKEDCFAKGEEEKRPNMTHEEHKHTPCEMKDNASGIKLHDSNRSIVFSREKQLQRFKITHRKCSNRPNGNPIQRIQTINNGNSMSMKNKEREKTKQ